MTKQEIYVKLGYTGSYTKEVKRRLRELIKKYHPDLNHGDDKTMKLLNEVKGELEETKVDEVFYQTFDEVETVVDTNLDNDEYDYFKDVSSEDLNRKIEKLKVEKQEEYDKLIDIDKKLGDLNVIFKRKLNKYEEEKQKIDSLNDIKNNINFKLYITIFVILVFCLVISVIFFNIYLIGFFLITLIITSIYFIHKYILLMDINKKISTSYANKNTYFNEVMDSRIEIVNASKLRFSRYLKYRQKADDIQLYTVELSRKNNKTVTIQKNTSIRR